MVGPLRGNELDSLRVRMARPADADQIQAIYAAFVTETAISFEIEPPSVAEMAERVKDTLTDYPWLVVEAGDQVLGYAYGHRFSGRAAYDWSVETTIYLHPACQGRGVGARLYRVLLELLREGGYRQAFAGIALPNQASVALHQRTGFEPVGVYRRVGWKLGTWRDVGWWQADLARTEAGPREASRLGEIDPQTLRWLLNDF